jgi:flagellar biosynthesis/type III secretory pathway chaperone
MKKDRPGTDAFAAIEDILAEQLSTYQELITLSRGEQRCLVQGRADDLPAITAAKESALSRISVLEERRQHAVRLLPIAYDGDRGKLNLQALSALLPEVWKRRYQELQRRLSAALEELHFLNEYNASLIRHCLEYTSYLLSFLTGDANAPLYTGAGELLPKGSPRVLNRRV